MNPRHKVLIIDDHPLICDSYRDALQTVMKRNGNVQMKIETAGN